MSKMPLYKTRADKAFQNMQLEMLRPPKTEVRLNEAFPRLIFHDSANHQSFMSPKERYFQFIILHEVARPNSYLLQLFPINIHIYRFLQTFQRSFKCCRDGAKMPFCSEWGQWSESVCSASTPGASLCLQVFVDVELHHWKVNHQLLLSTEKEFQYQRTRIL